MNNRMAIVLAAGKGTRMGQTDLTKVCFEIDGVPAIDRQIAVFKRLGFGWRQGGELVECPDSIFIDRARSPLVFFASLPSSRFKGAGAAAGPATRCASSWPSGPRPYPARPPVVRKKKTCILLPRSLLRRTPLTTAEIHAFRPRRRPKTQSRDHTLYLKPELVINLRIRSP